MSRILNVLSLTKRYGNATALGDFSLSVEGGRIYGLLGPNGSGKTTGLHILAGLVRPDSGTVTVCEEPIESKASRRLVGFAPDDLPLPGALTGREYLDFHDAMRGRHDRVRAEPLIHALGLDGDLEKPIGQYSHGMKRKIQIVAALSHLPELLILDEPFRGLDPDAAAVLQSLLQDFTRAGRAVLVATHDMIRAQRDCDHVTILNHGATVASGTPGDLVAANPSTSNLEEVFLSLTGLQANSKARQDSIKLLFSRDEPLPEGAHGEHAN